MFLSLPNFGWGFCWWLTRNRLHCPELLKSNECHKVNINWRQSKKRKKKKTHFKKSKLFFCFPPHLQPTNLPTHSDRLPPGVCSGDNWFMCSFAFPLVPAAEYRTGLLLRQPTQHWQIRGAVRNSCPLTELVQTTRSCWKMLGGRI